MKTRKFALCLAAVFLVAIYINIQRSHTFTLSDDEGTIKTEQIQPLWGTVKVSGDCDTDVVFTDVETGEKYKIGYITQGVTERIKLERGKWYKVVGRGNLTLKALEAQLCYDQHSPEEVARQILKAACKFYDADWCGLIQVDLDLKIWTPFWWYNDSSEDKTTILTEEFESAEFLDRWVQAVRHGKPMIVPDAEEVKNTYPAEYNLYQRLGIRSVLGASLEPRPVALLAVRNPKRYISETSILRLLAYVLLVAYKDKKMNDGLNMAFAPENIESSHDVFVSLFGELKIYTSHGILREADLKSPKISRLLTYLLISGKKAHSSLEIAQALWPDDSTNPAKNMRNLIYRLRQTFGLISEKELIVSTASGYQFNPDLHIMTDYQQFDDLIQLASKASSVINRVELLKNAIDLYCGKILSSADGEHWLIQFAAKYHIAYVGAVNELLKQLNALHSYDLLNQYAARSLAIVPENSRGYYWLIHSLKVQGMDELASNEYQLAKQHLTTEEYKELCTSLGDSCE